MTAGFVLGSLDLMDTTGSPFAVETMADGTDFGNPQPIEVAIRSLLQDGSATVHEGDDNRELPLRIKISASDSGGLAQGEEALMAELYRRNTLTYTPADGWGPPTVFDVVTSSLAFSTDDLAENRGEHYWLVRLVCLPFGRSETAVTISPTPTTIGTARQTSYSFTVDGSARTEAAVHVGGGASTSALDNTLFYTRPGAQGMIPLRQYRTAGGATTTDAAMVSGAYDQNLETQFVADIPKANVPDGTYVLVARLRSASGSGSAVLTVDALTVIGSTTVDTTTQAVTVPGLSTTYGLYQLGPAFQLPSALVVTEAGAYISVRIQDAASGLTVRMDEAWLIEVGSGCLSWPVLDVGGPVHVWAEPPSTSQPLRRVIAGVSADQSDAFGVADLSGGAHVLEPGANFGFVVTDGNTTSTMTLTVDKRWHTHAAS